MVRAAYDGRRQRDLSGSTIELNMTVYDVLQAGRYLRKTKVETSRRDIYDDTSVYHGHSKLGARDATEMGS